MRHAGKKRLRAPRTPAQLEQQQRFLEPHKIKPGEVRNPHGHNGTAAQRFRRIFEAVATDEKLRELALAMLSRGRLREMSVERLWPRTDRLELGAIGESEAHERQAAREKLERLLGAKGRP